MKNYHKENCNSKLRATITDIWGRKISLFGTHAFEWQIVFEKDNRIVIQSFKTGKEARKEFKKYK